MANIGVLPTRTSVSITSSNGENGTIDGATPKQAGCMTAEQAAQLDALYRASLTNDAGSAAIVITPPLPRVDAVSRSELRQAMTELQRAIAATQSVSGISHDAGLIERLAALEMHVGSFEYRVVALAQIVDGMCNLLDGIQADQKFIERHAVAQIGVQQ